MQITGIVGLTDVFGGSERTWKERIGSGIPVAERSGRGKSYQFNSVDVFRWLAARGTSQPTLDPPMTALAEARLRLAHVLGERGMKADDIIARLNASPGA